MIERTDPSLPDLLKHSRESCCLSFHQLSRLSGINPGDLHRYENGRLRFPRDREKLFRLASALKLTRDDTERLLVGAGADWMDNKPVKSSKGLGQRDIFEIPGGVAILSDSTEGYSEWDNAYTSVESLEGPKYLVGRLPTGVCQPIELWVRYYRFFGATQGEIEDMCARRAARLSQWEEQISRHQHIEIYSKRSLRKFFTSGQYYGVEVPNCMMVEFLDRFVSFLDHPNYHVFLRDHGCPQTFAIKEVDSGQTVKAVALVEFGGWEAPAEPLVFTGGMVITREDLVATYRKEFDRNLHCIGDEERCKAHTMLFLWNLRQELL